MDNSEENTTDVVNEPDGQPREDTNDVVSRRELQRVIGQRQDLRTKLRDANAKLAEFESAAQEQVEAKMRADGELQKLLDEKDAKLAEAISTIDSMNRSQRATLAIDAVTSKLEGVDRSMVHALMLLQEKQGVDIAPEEVSTDFVDTMVGRIKDAAPSLFKPQGVGGTPGVPGTDSKETGEAARIKRLAKKYSRG